MASNLIAVVPVGAMTRLVRSRQGGAGDLVGERGLHGLSRFSSLVGHGPHVDQERLDLAPDELAGRLGGVFGPIR